MIISVSRRCDIPRYQFKWFMARLDAGYCVAVNPFNANQQKRIPLKPEDVDLFVFWTRNPRNILANADVLDNRSYRYYVMVTVTGYPVMLEPSMTRTSKVIHAMKELANKIGSDRVIWRYDPIILTSVTDEDFHRRNFLEIAQKLSGSVRRVIISFYDEYRGAKQRLEILEKTHGVKLLYKEVENEDKSPLLPMLADFANSAASAGMEIQSCAEKENFSPVGIKPGACIDAELIKKIWGLDPGGKDKNQRKNCLCCKSTDIGAYGICQSRCVYCYAWN